MFQHGKGAIDWDTVANYGMDFAILRITEAGNVIDSCFEQKLLRMSET